MPPLSSGFPSSQLRIRRNAPLELWICAFGVQIFSERPLDVCRRPPPALNLYNGRAPIRLRVRPNAPLQLWQRPPSSCDSALVQLWQRPPPAVVGLHLRTCVPPAEAPLKRRPAAPDVRLPS